LTGSLVTATHALLLALYEAGVCLERAGRSTIVVYLDFDDFGKARDSLAGTAWAPPAPSALEFSCNGIVFRRRPARKRVPA